MKGVASCFSPPFPTNHNFYWQFFYIFSAHRVQTTSKSPEKRFYEDGIDERSLSATHLLRGGKDPNQGKIRGVTHLSESEKKLKVIDMRLSFNLYPAWNQPLTLRRRQFVFLVRVYHLAKVAGIFFHSGCVCFRNLDFVNDISKMASYWFCCQISHN